MARYQAPVDETPPFLAEAIVSFFARAEDKIVFLGDLQESFGALAIHSARRAQSWYWRQVIFSLPYLVRQRLDLKTLRRIAFVMASALIAVDVIYSWDMYVARSALQYLDQTSQASMQFMVRALYIALQMAGVALAGGLVALICFNKAKGFIANFFLCLGPVILMLAALSVMTILTSEGSSQTAYLLMRTGLSIPALLGGACIALRVFSSKLKRG